MSHMYPIASMRLVYLHRFTININYINVGICYRSHGWYGHGIPSKDAALKLIHPKKSEFSQVGSKNTKNTGGSFQRNLGGGFKYVLFSPLFGEDSHLG